MTAIDTREEVPSAPELAAPVAPEPEPARRRTTASEPLSTGAIVALALGWGVVTVLSMMLVLYGLEPLFQERTQAQLFSDYTLKIEQSANETGGLGGVTVPTLAPELGAPVAILEIGRLQLQQVVVEGAQPSQTQSGPGHVPGTAGPGQPGNSAVVGRRGTFGAPFRNLDTLQDDDEILVSTTQGQSVYKVVSVQQQRIGVAAADAAASPGTTDTTAESTTTTSAADPGAGSTTTTVPTLQVPRQDTVSLADLYGSTTDDRLTLVSSASANPRNADTATVVVAQMQGLPFPPTPQGGRTDSQTGVHGDAAALAPFLLALVGFAAAAAAAVVLYRRSSIRVAYLLTTPPLIAFIILAAESFSRFFPSWM